MKRLAVIGSSGGHLFVLGGRDPKGLLGEIIQQAKAASFEVTDIVFVGASTSLDSVSEATTASVWRMLDDGPQPGESLPLAEANQKAKEYCEELARKIRKGEIDALILVSADPKGINKEVILAAAETKIPVVGTGGTSMADARAMGANVIAASGTTGSTNRTRAIGYISALAGHWKVKYTPVIGKVTEVQTSEVWKRIHFRSIMMGSLPGFIAMALVLAIGKIPFLSESFGPLFDLLVGALPVIVAVVAAKQVSGLEEVGIVAGVVAGVLSREGGILGGIVGGIGAGILASYLLNWSFRMRFPATTASLVAGAIGGLTAGFVVYFLLAPVTLWLGNGVRGLIQTALNYNAILAGAVAGLLIWPAIIGGVYHAAILPIVLLEMETQGNSFLGAIDMTGLVMVSAGITLANVLFPRQKSEAALALPGFLVNVGFGTFVEAAYPFMFSDKRVFGTALFAAMVGGAFCGFFNARGTAYVPSIIAPTVSNNPLGFLVAMLVSMGVACALTIVFNLASRKQGEEVVETLA
jgi:fructose-specific phosphotransferase system IIC component